MGRVVLLAMTVMLLVEEWRSGAAFAAPSPRQRVVLADPDPELRHAMEQALAPWHLEVVIEGSPPADTGIAEERADADTARFVVWRDRDQLVVYDRELGSTERRDSRAGVLDAPTAAAAALTIKTMMRLPPPPPPPDDAGAPAPPPAGAAAGLDLRLQAGAATRIAQGLDLITSTRFGAVVAIRPWPRAGWRFGVAGEGGTASGVTGRASFRGTWRDWAALGLVSWTYARGAWELEPHGGFGLHHSTVGGVMMTTTISDKPKTLAIARGGVWARWRHGQWSLGATLDFDEIFGTRAYIDDKANGMANGTTEYFQVPGTGVDLGVFGAVDL